MALPKETIKKQEIIQMDKHFLHPTSSIKQQHENGPAKIFTKGEGIYLYDIDGNKYIDGLSCLWNVNVGHGRKELGEVASQQMEQLGFSSAFGTFTHEPGARLAAKITEHTPERLNKIFFTSGGSESNDTAFKMVRNYWKLKGNPNKKKIVSRSNSYHGVAMGATSATGLKPFRDFTTSLAPDFYHVHSTPDAFEKFILDEGADTIAAFISEPVQGTGGVVLAPDNYFKEIRALCDKYNILFIADEVITGFGRTGTYFGIEQYGVVPDMMTLAKGITSGYIPLGGVVISDEMFEVFKNETEGNFMHGYTYSGHPTATAVALKNLEIIENEDLVENARKMGELMLDKFKGLASKYHLIGEVRGLGLMGAIEIFSDAEKELRFNEPLSPILAAEATEMGLIFRSVIYEGADTLIFAPPLTITEQELDEMINILDDLFMSYSKKYSAE